MSGGESVAADKQPARAFDRRRVIRKHKAAGFSRLPTIFAF